MAIVDVGRQDPPQVPFAPNNDVIQALASDRPDEALGVSILPGRAQGRQHVQHPHGRQSRLERGTAGSVTVPDQVSGRGLPWRRLYDLPCQPRCRRIARDAALRYLPTNVQKHDERVEQPPYWRSLLDTLVSNPSPAQKFETASHFPRSARSPTGRRVCRFVG